jgi:hypothetical protein
MTPAQFQAEFQGSGVGHGDPVNTAFVYIAAPLADPGFQLTATPAGTATATPEPSAMLLGAVGIGLIGLWKAKVSTTRS